MGWGFELARICMFSILNMEEFWSKESAFKSKWLRGKWLHRRMITSWNDAWGNIKRRHRKLIRAFANLILLNSLINCKQRTVQKKSCSSRAFERNLGFYDESWNQLIFLSSNAKGLPGGGEGGEVEATNWLTHYVLPCNKYLNKRSVL